MRLVFVAAVVAALATAAAAQPAAAPPPELVPGAGPPDQPADAAEHAHAGPRGDRGGPRGPHLFISPSGEPFRTGDGLGDWFAQADANHDGVVTAEEFQADALRAFQIYDLNGDGVIDGFEVQAYEQRRVPEITQFTNDDARRPSGGGGGGGGGGMGGMGGGGMGGRGGGMGGGGMGGGGMGGGGMGGRGGGMGGGGMGGPMGGAEVQPASTPQPRAGREGAARWSLLNEPEPLLVADENIDGRVSRQEWLHATARRFAKLDHDKTGRLTLVELRAGTPKR